MVAFAHGQILYQSGTVCDARARRNDGNYHFGRWNPAAGPLPLEGFAYQ